MKVFRKIDISSIRLNPDYSLVEEKIPTTIDVRFKIIDPAVVRECEGKMGVEVIYPEWRNEENYFITDITFGDDVFEIYGFIQGIELTNRKWAGIEIEVKQNHQYTFPDTRRYLYDYEKMPKLKVKCGDCKSKFYFKYLDDDHCPVCGSLVEHGIEIEYEEFNEEMCPKGN